MLVAQLCPTLCNPMDESPPGSTVHGILQARILEWVAMPFSRGSYWPRNWIQVSLHCKQILYHLSYREATYMCVCVCVYIYTQHILFMHSCVGHFGCFHIFVTVNNAAVNMGCLYLFKLVSILTTFIQLVLKVLPLQSDKKKKQKEFKLERKK